MGHDNGREDQHPWDKFYWADLESDTGLRSCSLAAQGLWMRMLCIMARAKIKGYLLDGEKQMESKTLARLVGEFDDTVRPLLSELAEHAVYSLTDDGTIYNRRMVREGHISQVRSEAGKKGGRPKKQNGSKAKAPSASVYAYASASISFLKGVWGGITDADRVAWAEAFQACDIDGELKRMASWLVANPSKKKSNYRRFIHNWLTRTQDRGGTRTNDAGAAGCRPVDAVSRDAQNEAHRLAWERRKAKEAQGE